MATITEVRVTCDTETTAFNMAETLTRQRLAACVHVEGPLTSTYWWDGKIQQEPEWVLTAKTTGEYTPSVVACLADMHPYDLPGIVWHSLETTDAFADWIAEETRKSE